MKCRDKIRGSLQRMGALAIANSLRTMRVAALIFMKVLLVPWNSILTQRKSGTLEQRKRQQGTHSPTSDLPHPQLGTISKVEM